MDNAFVAMPANHQCLALFRNHDTFPMLFSFQIFELVDMVDFIKLAVCRTAKLAYMSLEPIFKGVDSIAVHNCRIADNIGIIIICFAFGIVSKEADFCSAFCFVRYTPVLSAPIFSDDLGNAAFVP